MGVSTDAILVYGYNLDENALSDETVTMLREDYTLEEKLKPLGIEIVYHAADEYTMYILGVSDSEYRAWRGSVVPITDLEDYSEKDADLIRGLAILGVDPIDFEPPRWYLVSWWG